MYIDDVSLLARIIGYVIIFTVLILFGFLTKILKGTLVRLGVDSETATPVSVTFVGFLILWVLVEVNVA